MPEGLREQVGRSRRASPSQPSFPRPLGPGRFGLSKKTERKVEPYYGIGRREGR